MCIIMPFYDFTSAHLLSLEYVSLWNLFGLLEWVFRGIFLSDFSCKSKDCIKFDNFIAISNDNIFCNKRIPVSQWILNGYKNWEMKMYIKCMTSCQLLKWQMVSYRMSANNPPFPFWCDTLNYLNTFQITTCRLRNEFAIYSHIPGHTALLST